MPLKYTRAWFRIRCAVTEFFVCVPRPASHRHRTGYASASSTTMIGQEEIFVAAFRPLMFA